MTIGYDVTRTIASTAMDQGKGHGLGDCARTHDGNEYVYVQADGSITGEGYVVIIDENYQAAEITNTTGVFGQKVGVAQTAFSDNDYGWVQVCGTTNIQVAASCAANAVITTTTTGGQLDDAAGVGTKTISGAVLTTARAASAGTAEGVLTYPTVGATN